MRKIVAVVLVAAFGAACDRGEGGEGTVSQDTLVETVGGDTTLIERTVTDDTLQVPDTTRADTTRRDTLPR
jgi:hypothetical protein